MDYLTILMDDMTEFTYFSGLNFESCNISPKCKTWVDAKLAEYAINYADKGYIHFQESSTKTVRLDSPVAWWTLPGRRYRYGSLDGIPWEQRWISFRGKRADRYVQSGLLPDLKLPVLKIQNRQQFLASFDAIITYLSSSSYSVCRATHMFEGLLLQLHEQEFLPDDNVPHSDLIMEFSRQIKQVPENNWNFRKKAKAMGLSYSRFRQVFKKVMKEAPQTYLIKCRLAKAARLLKTTAMTVSEIAHESGFDDVYYFSRTFKKYYHNPPSSFKNKFYF